MQTYVDIGPLEPSFGRSLVFVGRGDLRNDVYAILYGGSDRLQLPIMEFYIFLVVGAVV